METIALAVSALALASPFVAVWISHRKLKPELVKLSAELEHARLQIGEARAAEKKRVREHVDQVSVRVIGLEPDDDMEEFAAMVLEYLPGHSDPLNVLCAVVSNEGFYPIRDLALSTVNYRPSKATMNGENAEYIVRDVPDGLVPLRSGEGAAFAFPEVEASAEVDKLALWFTDDDGRRWKKDVHGVATRVDV